MKFHYVKFHQDLRWQNLAMAAKTENTRKVKLHSLQIKTQSIENISHSKSLMRFYMTSHSHGAQHGDA